MRNTCRLGSLGVLMVTLALSADADPVLLVSTNATWSYARGTSHPSPADPAAWRANGFAAATWSVGSTPFWYGEGERFSGTGTEISDMQNAFSTLFLLRRFSIANPAAWESLQLRAMCDDGFRAWINGRPIADQRAPAGEPGHDTLAGANAPEPAVFEPFVIESPSEFLVAGDNVLAVQVFNVSLGSSDIVFDAELSGEPALLGPPTVASVQPPPGPITNLTEITVTFSEPVQGVQADALLVNGASAIAVSGAGATYTFTFPKPAYGQVEVFWNTFHTITDFEVPPVRFELSAPGSTWTYDLLDPIGPSVQSTLPPPGLTIRSLSQLEVTFNKAVTGLDAADLTLNGIPASHVSGFGAGPYTFDFPVLAAGAANAAWVPTHGIVSDTLEPHPFAGGSWRYTVDPTTQPPALTITEFMAETFSAFRDEDQDPEDWIEIHNPTSSAVSLEGWSISNDDRQPGQWVFPRVILPPGGYLVVFASAKDRLETSGVARLHTNFKLNPTGGYLALFSPELPRVAVSEVAYPRQGPDFSFGRDRGSGEWRYFQNGSPGALNPASTISEAVAEVHFSVPRGFFNQPFDLTLHCPTPGATIRFTTNGSPPTATDGFAYSQPLRIAANRVIRAAAFKSNALPSRVSTHTYLVNLASARLRLPALSLVTATNHLYGRTGIMETSPRNTTKRGPAWERPVSVEYIRVDDNGGFQSDCGLRIQGGDYVRGQYNYRSTSLPFSKYSFRLYFRGEYGEGRLDYPLFPETTQTSFDTVVLRAGMNDHSNPYLTDELVRSLARDCGQPASVGTFVHLFLNGVYKGYYNPCERYDVDFLRAYHGGGEAWDVMAQAGEVREGTAIFWNTLRTLVTTRDLTIATNYQDITRRLDVTNFVDYLCPLIYVDNDDWPHNNWRAARERTTNGLYRMYVWDAEWAFGLINGAHGPSWNTVANQLSSTAPPWGGTDIQRLYIGLRRSPEFRLLFADRAHRHFFNGGALTDDRIRARYAVLTNRLNGVVTGFNNRIATTWIPQRRRYVLQHLERAGLLASSNAPALSQHGGPVTPGFTLTITNLTGSILYTTNGTDPRIPFTGAIAPGALTYRAPLSLPHSLTLSARSRSGTNWSALTEATFEVGELSSPVRIAEIMYHPSGGDVFEFIELVNPSPVPAPVSGFSFRGIDFRFPEPFPDMPPGARWVLASDDRPADFQARYPLLNVTGWFGGSLANAGERLELVDRSGTVLDSIDYGDSEPWPAQADGAGSSLELLDLDAAPHDPAAWFASPNPGGTPAEPPHPRLLPQVHLAEIVTLDPPGSDWIELRNAGPIPVLLADWGLTDGAQPHRFRFPAGTTLAPGARLRLWCDTNAAPAGFHTGFGLSRAGETISLYDAATNRVDAVTFGSLPPGSGLGRLNDGDAWVLTEPTPEAPNEPAALASPTVLAINEWLANPPAGEPDWIEFHNTDPTRPVSLHGLTLTLNASRARLAAHNFVPPSGFLVLQADEGVGPDHLPLRLPAAGGTLRLLDATGRELSRTTLGTASTEGVSYGLLPDAIGAVRPFPGTPSPGASNYLAAARGPLISEWMARNAGSVPGPDGRPADWIELVYLGQGSFDLGGCRIRIGEGADSNWTFPAGVQLASGAYLVLWCDPDHAPSTLADGPLHLGRGLPGEGGSFQLLSPVGQVLDAVSYGPQLEDRSVGRLSAGFGLLASPTPGTVNGLAATLGSSGSIRINEWLAHSVATDDDWFELYNPNPHPVDLSDFVLTDDPSLAGLTKFPLPPLSFVDGPGYVRWIADGRPDRGGDHVNFSLDDNGETLRLLAPTRLPVDSVAIVPGPPDISLGRFPDGEESQVPFPDSPSPGRGNWLPHPGVVINELLAHTDPPLEDAIELLNPSSTAATPIGGWWLSDEDRRLDKFRIPEGLTLAPGAYHVLFEQAFRPPGSPNAFTLSSSQGGGLWLSEVDASGQPTGYRAHASFGPTANAVSLGRFATSVGWEFVPLSRRTFGKDSPSSLAEFRQSQGLPNAYPLVGPMVISEIHYRPVSDAAPDDEFIELYNTASQTVPLYDPAFPTNTWRIRGGIQFTLPAGAALPAFSFALIVPFHPTNSAAVQAFRNLHGLSASIPIWGPFSGRLANEGDEIRLERPDTPQAPPQPDAGLVPYVLVESIRYLADAPWPALSVTNRQSLQRQRLAEFGNDPVRWIAASPTPGQPTSGPDPDRDGDGLPNDWENTHGLDPDNPSDAVLDFDADGHSNLAEFLAGTDPRAATSALRLALVRASSGEPSLRFPAIANRTYTVQVRTDLSSGAWQKLSDIPAEPQDHDVSVALDISHSQPAFYRVVSPATP